MKKKRLSLVCLFTLLSSFTFSEKYTIFKFNGKYGLADTKLNVAVSPVYDKILAKSDDFYIAVKFYNSSYKSYIIKEAQVIYSEESQGFAQIYKNLFVKVKGEKYNLDGKILFDCITKENIYNDWGIYETSLPVIPVRGEESWYFIDERGNRLEKLKDYKAAFGFYENNAVVMGYDKKYTVIDKNGNKRFSYKINDCDQRYSEGMLAAIMESGESGFIDYNGVMKIPRTFYFLDGKFAVTEFSNGFACVKSSEYGQKWDIIDTKGNTVADFLSVDIPTKFCDNFSLTTIMLNNKKKWGFINVNGSLLADRYFDNADEFLNGWAPVITDGKDALINTSGEIVLVSDILPLIEKQ